MKNVERNETVNVSFPVDVRAYVRLARRSKNRGVTVDSYIVDRLASSFLPKGVESTASRRNVRSVRA